MRDTDRSVLQSPKVILWVLTNWLQSLYGETRDPEEPAKH